MADKIKEFIEQSSFDASYLSKVDEYGAAWYENETGYSINIIALIEEAIEFGEKKGSNMTAERAKEKIETELTRFDEIGEAYEAGLKIGLQAIEESVLYND